MIQALEEAIIRSHKEYLERKWLYKSFGYDIDKERSFIIEKAQPIYGNILEAGTGKGYFTLALAKEGYKFTTFDILEEQQEFAKLNLRYFGLDKHVEFKIENGEHLSFEDASFDIIFSINMIHHLINPHKVIDEFIRILSPGGKIILSDFTKKGLEIADNVYTTEGRVHKKTKFSLSDIENYLVNAPFKIQKHRTMFQETLIANQGVCFSGEYYPYRLD